MDSYTLASKTRKVNVRATEKVIALHNQGYVFDFHVLDNQNITCLQDNRCFAFENTEITVVDQVYDQFSHSFKYIHTIRTCCGAMGLLLADCICFVGNT